MGKAVCVSGNTGASSEQKVFYSVNCKKAARRSQERGFSAVVQQRAVVGEHRREL